MAAYVQLIRSVFLCLCAAAPSPSGGWYGRILYLPVLRDILDVSPCCKVEFYVNTSSPVHAPPRGCRSIYAISSTYLSAGPRACMYLDMICFALNFNSLITVLHQCCNQVCISCLVNSYWSVSTASSMAGV
jgi:hypothetical protein